MFAASMVTDGIRVSVRTAYMEEESSPKHLHYAFAYQIEIENESDHVVKLLSREWHITDGIGRKELVEGEGVVGKQPLLHPGEEHTYVSGTHFQTPVGKMEGWYYFIRLPERTRFRVRIPAFSMVIPALCN